MRAVHGVVRTNHIRTLLRRRLGGPLPALRPSLFHHLREPLAALRRKPVLAFPATGGTSGRSASAFASGTDASDRGDRPFDAITFGSKLGKYAMDVQGRGFLLPMRFGEGSVPDRHAAAPLKRWPDSNHGGHSKPPADAAFPGSTSCGLGYTPRITPAAGQRVC